MAREGRSWQLPPRVGLRSAVSRASARREGDVTDAGRRRHPDEHAHQDAILILASRIDPDAPADLVATTTLMDVAVEREGRLALLDEAPDRLAAHGPHPRFAARVVLDAQALVQLRRSIDPGRMRRHVEVPDRDATGREPVAGLRDPSAKLLVR